MLWLFIAQGTVGAGEAERFLINAPTTDPGQAMDYAKQLVQAQRIRCGQVQYAPHLLQTNDQSLVMLCIQSKQSPLSGEGVAAGQSAPQGRNLPPGERDGSGFQAIGGDALGGISDNMYGDDPCQGTVADIYTNGQEMRR